jgi:hypothetical protein
LKERYVTSEAAEPSDSRVRWIEHRQVIKMYMILYFIGALNSPLEENIDNSFMIILIKEIAVGPLIENQL